ncbi:hypothetical protein F4604DRAFT_1606490, partial [Suillus subluteus]
CPALVSLALVIDTTKLDGIDLKSPGGDHFTKNLKDLILGNSVIDSPLNVALILSGLFPDLEQVNLDCWDTVLMHSLPQKKPAMDQCMESRTAVLISSRHKSLRGSRTSNTLWMSSMGNK